MRVARACAVLAASLFCLGARAQSATQTATVTPAPGCLVQTIRVENTPGVVSAAWVARARAGGVGRPARAAAAHVREGGGDARARASGH